MEETIYARREPSPFWPTKRTTYLYWDVQCTQPLYSHRLPSILPKNRKAFWHDGKYYHLQWVDPAVNC